MDLENNMIKGLIASLALKAITLIEDYIAGFKVLYDFSGLDEMQDENDSKLILHIFLACQFIY